MIDKKHCCKQHTTGTRKDQIISLTGIPEQLPEKQSHNTQTTAITVKNSTKNRK